MPKLTRYFIKTAFVYLMLAMLIGMLLALGRNVTLPGFAQYLSPIFFHFFMFGWVTQMIFGVAFRIFPNINRDQPRGSHKVGWLTYFLLNSGLLLRAVSEPTNALHDGTIWDWLLVLSAAFQWTAGLLFVFNSWPRIKKRRRL